VPIELCTSRTLCIQQTRLHRVVAAVFRLVRCDRAYRLIGSTGGTANDHQPAWQ